MKNENDNDMEKKEPMAVKKDEVNNNNTNDDDNNKADDDAVNNSCECIPEKINNSLSPPNPAR